MRHSGEPHAGRFAEAIAVDPVALLDVTVPLDSCEGGPDWWTRPRVTIPPAAVDCVGPQPDAGVVPSPTLDAHLYTGETVASPGLWRAMAPIWKLLIALLVLGAIGLGVVIALGGGDDEVGLQQSDDPELVATATPTDATPSAATPTPAEPPSSAELGTITVAVADVFGPTGVRVLPAPGVIVEVLDADGEVIAEAVTTEDLDAPVEISLEPGDYVVRLNIGGYEPALPPECTDGYVREFTLDAGATLEFRSRVYTSTVADDGTTVGTESGDCITLVDPP